MADILHSICVEFRAVRQGPVRPCICQTSLVSPRTAGHTNASLPRPLHTDNLSELESSRAASFNS